MHPESRAWVEAAVLIFGPFDTVVDLGGQDVNGTYRDLFPTAHYVAVDKLDGPGVDVVADVIDFLDSFRVVPANPGYDLAICTNVLEHEPRWKEILSTTHRCMAPGGIFVVTVPGPNFPTHSHTGAVLPEGEWYGAGNSKEIASWMVFGGFEVLTEWNDSTGMDAGAVGRRTSK